MMAQINVSLREQQISPKKIRLVMNLVRGKTASAAKVQLRSYNKKAAAITLRLLNSGLDAAKNRQLKEDSLYISEAVCNEGKKLKRYFIRARGRTSPYLKRSSHIKIGLDQIKKGQKDINPKKTVKNGSQS